MDERKIAVRNAKAGYVAIVVMLLVNVLLASFIFFEMNIDKTREIFLSIATLMSLVYAVTFPTKLLPSGVYLLRCIVFTMLPHILIQLIATGGESAVAITSYVISLVISAFCAYINVGYHKKVIAYIKEENYNDYALFEYKTFKIQEINIYSMAFILINFFIMMASSSNTVLMVLLYVNLFIGLTLNFYRTRQAKSERVKMVHYVLESICSLLAFTLIVVVNALDLSRVIYIGAFALMIPTIAVTVLVYKSLDHFMYH